MLFTTTKGKFAALFLVAFRFAAASAAPAQTDTAIYEVADDISIAPEAPPAIDTNLMLTEIDAADASEWNDIIAVVSDVEPFASSEHDDADNNELEVFFRRMPRCVGCGRRPIGRPRCPKCPRRPKCPKCPKSTPRLRRPKFGIHIPLPEIDIPGIGRLPLPKHIKIGIFSKGSKKGSKGRVPSGRRLPPGRDPRTRSPSGKATSKGKDRISVPPQDSWNQAHFANHPEERQRHVLLLHRRDCGGGGT